MAPNPILPLVDRILGGGLADYLRDRRTEGLSYERIARRLLEDHDIDVTTETVRTWAKELGVTGDKDAA